MKGMKVMQTISHTDLRNLRQCKVSGLYRRPNFIGNDKAISENLKALTGLNDVSIISESREHKDSAHANIASALASLRFLCSMVDPNEYKIYAFGFSAHYAPPNATLFTTEMDMYNRLRIEVKAGVEANTNFYDDAQRSIESLPELAIVGAFPTLPVCYNPNIPQLILSGTLHYEVNITGDIKTDERPAPRDYGQPYHEDPEMGQEWYRIPVYGAPGTYFYMNWQWKNHMLYRLHPQDVNDVVIARTQRVDYAGRVSSTAWDTYSRLRYPWYVANQKTIDETAEELEEWFEGCDDDEDYWGIYNPFTGNGYNAGWNLFGKHSKKSFKSYYIADGLDYALVGGALATADVALAIAGAPSIITSMVGGLALGNVIGSIGSFIAAKGYDMRSWWEGEVLNDIPDGCHFIPCDYVNADHDACTVPVVWMLYSCNTDWFQAHEAENNWKTYENLLHELIKECCDNPITRINNYSIAVMKSRLIGLSQVFLNDWCKEHVHYKYGQNGFKIVNAMKPQPGIYPVLDGDNLFSAGHVSLIHVLGDEYNAEEEIAKAKRFDEIISSQMDMLSFAHQQMAIERKVYDFHDVFLYKSDDGSDAEYTKWYFNFCNSSFDRETFETVKQRVTDDDARLSVTVAAMQQLKEGYSDAVKNIAPLKKFIIDNSNDAVKIMKERFESSKEGILNWKTWAGLTCVVATSLLIPSVRHAVVSSAKWIKEKMVCLTLGFTQRSLPHIIPHVVSVGMENTIAENQPATVLPVETVRIPFIPVNSTAAPSPPSLDPPTNVVAPSETTTEKPFQWDWKGREQQKKEEMNAEAEPTVKKEDIKQAPEGDLVKEDSVALSNEIKKKENSTNMDTGERDGAIKKEDVSEASGVMTGIDSSTQTLIEKDEEKLNRRGKQRIEEGYIWKVCNGELELGPLLKSGKLSKGQRANIFKRVRMNNGIKSEDLRDRLLQAVVSYKRTTGVSENDPDIQMYNTILREKHRMPSDVGVQPVNTEPCMREPCLKEEIVTEVSSEESSGVGEKLSMIEREIGNLERRMEEINGLTSRFLTQSQEISTLSQNLETFRLMIMSDLENVKETCASSSQENLTCLENQVQVMTASLNEKLSHFEEAMEKVQQDVVRSKQEQSTPFDLKQISEVPGVSLDLKITTIQEVQSLRDVLQGKSPYSSISVMNQDGTSVQQMSQASIDVSQDISGEKRLQALLDCLAVKKKEDCSTMLKEDLKTVVSEMKDQFTQVREELASLQRSYLALSNSISSNMDEIFDSSTVGMTTSSSTKGKKTEMKLSGHSKGLASTAELKENRHIQRGLSSFNTTTSGVAKTDPVQSMTQFAASVSRAAESTIRTAGLVPDTTVKSSVNSMNATSIFQSFADFFKKSETSSEEEVMENDHKNGKQNPKESCFFSQILTTLSVIWTFVSGSVSNFPSRFKNNCVLNVVIDTIAYKFGIYPGLIYAAMNSFLPIQTTQSASCSVGSVPNVMAKKGKGKLSRARAKNVANKGAASIAKLRSVKAAVPGIVNSLRMPVQSRDWLKSVLDPAHATLYAPSGIPDDNTKTSVVRTVHKTYSPSLIPNAGDNIYMNVNGVNKTIKNNAANVSWSINRVFFGLVESMAIDYIRVVEYNVTVSSGSDPAPGNYIGYGIAVVRNDETATFVNSETGDGSGRLINRGFTIEPIGMKMYRGGYFSAYSPNQSTYYVDNENQSYLCLPMATIDENPAETFGDQGVYATMIPFNISNMCKFRKTDSSDSLMLMTANGSYYKLSCGSVDNLMELQGWKQSWVAYYPPASITSANQKEFTSGMIALRVTCFSCIEVLKSKANGGQNIAIKDTASLESVVALGEFINGFYPASYNDLKKVIGNIRKFYNEHKDLIDVAAGFIPYGGTVNSVLNSLLNGSNSASTKGRKQLVRTM